MPVKPSIDVPKSGKTIPVGDRTPVVMNIGDNITSLTQTILSIKCPVIGVPQPNVTWSKDGLPLRSEGSFVIHINGTLTIRGVTTEDSGRYTCDVMSFAGKDKSTSNVRVIGKDDFPHVCFGQKVCSFPL